MSKRAIKRSSKMMSSNAYIISLTSKNLRRELFVFTKSMSKKKLKMNKEILISIGSMLIREDTLRIMSHTSGRCFRKIKKCINRRIQEL
jgi:hypothetical protein